MYPSNQHLQSTLGLSTEDARNIKGAMTCLKPDQALKRINEILQGMGIVKSRKDPLSEVEIKYVDRGSNFIPTIIFVCKSMDYYACSWSELSEERPKLAEVA